MVDHRILTPIRPLKLAQERTASFALSGHSFLTPAADNELMSANTSESGRVKETARQLRIILASMEDGHLRASATVWTRLEGVVTALELLAAEELRD